MAIYKSKLNNKNNKSRRVSNKEFRRLEKGLFRRGIFSELTIELVNTILFSGLMFMELFFRWSILNIVFFIVYIIAEYVNFRNTHINLRKVISTLFYRVIFGFVGCVTLMEVLNSGFEFNHSFLFRLIVYPLVFISAFTFTTLVTNVKGWITR